MSARIKYLKSIFFYFICLEVVLIGIILLLSSYPKSEFKAKRQLTKRFLLTDYCLSTESRHTRHLNSPEVIAPFQDFPGYLEHFPSSSFFQNPVIYTQIKAAK